MTLLPSGLTFADLCCLPNIDGLQIRTLEVANAQLTDDRVAKEHAQAMIKTLDKTAADFRVKCLELEAQNEQYRRALQANAINQAQVSNMAGKMEELHVKVASLESACDRYRLQEEEWQTKLNQADGQARVILIMSEQLEEWRNKCGALEDACMRFQQDAKDAEGMQSMLDRMQKEYASVSENAHQLERANAAMELQLERSKAAGSLVPSLSNKPINSLISQPSGVPF